MVRWRLPLVAALAWIQIFVILHFGLLTLLVGFLPVSVLLLSLIWNQPALSKIAMAWALLALTCWIQLDYRALATQTLEEGVQEYQFEALGTSTEIGGEYLSWVLLGNSNSTEFLIPGRLQTPEPLLASTKYRAVINLDPISKSADRAAFWATQIGANQVVDQPNGSDQFFIDLRRRFLESITGLTPDSTALVAGLAIGERTLLSPLLSDRMKSLSLTHLVAVSGANLAIVAGGVYLLLSSMGIKRNTRAIGAVLAIVGYVALVGPEPSVLRAAFMALLVIFGQMLGRGNQSLNSLGLAVICLVHLDPFLAIDFGFALSVIATFGLLVLAPNLYLRLRPKFHPALAASLSVALAAQLYTLPVLLLIENRLATYSVLANLLAEPVVAPVTVLGIASVLASFSLPALGAGLSWLASLGTAWIEWVANTLSQLPGVTLPWLPQPYATGISLLLVASLTLWVTSQKLAWLALSSALLFMSLGWSATNVVRYGAWPASNWDLIACDVAQGDALVIKSNSEVMLIDTGREPEMLAHCLSQAGVTEIDLLVLTHFDADHVAAVPNLLEDVKVTQVLVSGFPDERPLTEIVYSAIRNNRIPVVKAQVGMQFHFGNGLVSILQPTLNAREASDSNDASVIVSAEFPEYFLLALGDLGRAGQERLMQNQLDHLQKLAEGRLILKVSHHGSKDQLPELTQLLKPDYALISVGANNSYGHPTVEALNMLRDSGSVALRTDENGSIGLNLEVGTQIFVAGKL